MQAIRQSGILTVGIFLGSIFAYHSAAATVLVYVANDGIEYVSSANCSKTLCRAPPSGIPCEPTHIKQDDRGCCSQWRCTNGSTTLTIYGIRQDTGLFGGSTSSFRITSPFPFSFVGMMAVVAFFSASGIDSFI